jgi:uncharacterized protein
MAPEPFDTPHGLAQAYLHPVPDARAALVLGHGAGGSVRAPDLTAVLDVACAAGVTTVLVEQPYRVAGRRSPAPATQLDTAWVSVVDQLRAGALAGLPLIVGGRSSGARVACRTVEQTAAVAVLCLAFPLQPLRREGSQPAASRLSELDAVTVPTLVVQGVGDPFGMPPPGPVRAVVQVAGNHGLSSDLPAVAAAVEAWLERCQPALGAAPSRPGSWG